MRVLAILLLLPCALVQAQESGAQADQVPDFISYFQGPDNGTASSTIAATNAILQKQQMSRVLSNLVLELHSATAFNSFASQLFALTADAPNSELLVKPAPINRPFGFEEEDEDEQPRSFEEEETNAFENLMASLYGPTYLNTLNSPYVAENPYYKAQVESMNKLKDLGRQGRADLFEDGLETALAYVLKLSQIENINKLDQAQVSHSQNSLALVILSGSQYASNPLAIQMMYLLKFKMFLDTAGSSASIVRQDAWTMWNYNEMIETRLDSIPNEFQKIISTYKSTAMNSWLMEAQIDLMNLYLDYYIQTITGALTGSMGSGSAGSAGSVPQTEAQNSTGNAFLELEEMSQQSSSIANPQAILYYASYFRILLRINNYVAAQSNALESQLEYYISYGEVNDAEKLKSSADMLKFVHTQAVYSFRSLGYLRLTLASLDMTLFTLAGGLSGSLAGSLGGSMYPATSLGNSFGGSLGTAAGSLGLAAGSLGAATSSLGPVAGLAGLGSMGGYGSLALSALAGSSVGGSLASKAAMHMLHNLIQEDAKAEENLNTDPVAEPVAEAVAPQTAAPVQAPAAPAPAPAPAVAPAPAPVAAAPAVSAPAPKAPAAQPVVENKSLLTEAPVPAVKEAFPAIESEYKSLVG